MSSASASPPSIPRPRLVLIISWLFIVVGIGGLMLHAREINFHALVDRDLILAAVVRILAVVGGAFLLRGASWARWLLIAWTFYHVGLSVFHPLSELITHCVIMVVVSFALFRPEVSEFLRPQANQDSIS